MGPLKWEVCGWGIVGSRPEEKMPPPFPHTLLCGRSTAVPRLFPLPTMHAFRSNVCVLAAGWEGMGLGSGGWAGGQAMLGRIPGWGSQRTLGGRLRLALDGVLVWYQPGPGRFRSPDFEPPHGPWLASLTTAWGLQRCPGWLPYPLGQLSADVVTCPLWCMVWACSGVAVRWTL